MDETWHYNFGLFSKNLQLIYIASQTNVNEVKFYKLLSLDKQWSNALIESSRFMSSHLRVLEDVKTKRANIDFKSILL